MTKRDTIKGSPQSNGASVHVSIRVPRPIWEAVEEWATSAGMPASRAMVRMTELYLQTGTEHEPEATAAVERRGPRSRKPEDCDHPRSARKNLGYAVVCGVCGQRV